MSAGPTGGLCNCHHFETYLLSWPRYRSMEPQHNVHSNRSQSVVSGCSSRTARSAEDCRVDDLETSHWHVPGPSSKHVLILGVGNFCSDRELYVHAKRPCCMAEPATRKSAEVEIDLTTPLRCRHGNAAICGGSPINGFEDFSAL